MVSPPPLPCSSLPSPGDLVSRQGWRGFIANGCRGRGGVEGQVGGDRWAVLEGRCWIEDGGEACEDGGRASEDGGGATQREEEEEEWGGALTLRDEA
jgi:hypothetical protein